jgi:serine/threonine protein kinase
MKLSDFDIGECIGRGNFGEIYRVTKKSDDAEYALKAIHMNRIETKIQMEHLLREK